jgi:hypothetical protein
MMIATIHAYTTFIRMEMHSGPRLIGPGQLTWAKRFEGE